MRLIDEKEVIIRLVEESKKSQKGVIHINTIKRILQDVDTAYDVKAVVKELEEAAVSGMAGVSFNKNVMEIIGIVKKGGVGRRKYLI